MTSVRGAVLVVLALVLAMPSVALAQWPVVQQIGGVAIDAGGLLSRVSPQEVRDLSQKLTQQLSAVPGELRRETPLRQVSLKKIDATIREYIDAQQELPNDMRFLGGLTAIKYVVAVPEENDILLIGPGEGWSVGPEYTLVGEASGEPVLWLEDLITIFRSMNKPRLEVITCSIDPSTEAAARLEQLRRRGAPQRGEERAYALALEEAFGQSVVSFQGVPTDSRIAKILVAADYKMKQIGLEQTASPVRQIPSYVSLLRSPRSNVSPRFWFTADYSQLSHDSTKCLWELGGVSVKVQTEDEYTDARTGTRSQSGRVDPAAIRWCDAMNKNFAALAKADPVFAEMRNVMDLSMVVALIMREGLLDKAACPLKAFTDDTVIKLPKYPVPRYVPSESTIKGNVVACGGVSINPFEAVERPRLNTSLDKNVKTLATFGANTWFNNLP